MRYHRGVRKTVLAGVIGLMLIICASILVTDLSRIRHQNTGDFEHFYFAAQAVHLGADPYAAHTRGYIYPPLIAFLFQPLALLTYNHAAAVMLAVNVAVTLLAVALAVDEFLKRFNAPRSWFILASIMLPALLLNIDKIKGEWQMWQTDVWMLLLFVMALRWIDKRPLLAGIALGMAINIKYIPLVFLPYLLIRRRWTAAVGLIVGTIGFAILPAVSTGWTANCRNWGYRYQRPFTDGRCSIQPHRNSRGARCERFAELFDHQCDGPCHRFAFGSRIYIGRDSLANFSRHRLADVSPAARRPVH